MAQKRKKEKDSTSGEMLRRFKSNPGVFIGTFLVLILIVISFVIIPALSPESRGSSMDFIFGYYDKIPISWVPGNFFAQYQENLTRYYQSIMDQDNLQYAMMNIWRQAFEAASVHTAILQEMKLSKYDVPESIVDRQVAKLPQFQENGRFSTTLYQQMPNNSRLALWRQVKDDLIKEVYISDVMGLLISSKEAEFIGRMSANARSFEIVFFQIDDFPDSEYYTYALANPDIFRSVHLSMISVNSSEREARQILASITEGTLTFEEAARSQSQDHYADRGGDMGSRLIYELEYEIMDSQQRQRIISLRRGELSDVIRLGETWAFFRVEEELKSADFEDEETMEKVRSYIRNFERGRMEDWAIAKAREFINDANDSDIYSALINIDKEFQSFGPIPINYGDVDLFASLESFSIPELAYSSTNENFWQIAFSTPPDTLSEPFVQGNNVIVFLPVEQIDFDEFSIEATASTYSSYWLKNSMEQSLYLYFINSQKMDNQFFDTYFRLFMPMGF